MIIPLQNNLYLSYTRPLCGTSVHPLSERLFYYLHPSLLRKVFALLLINCCSLNNTWTTGGWSCCAWADQVPMSSQRARKRKKPQNCLSFWLKGIACTFIGLIFQNFMSHPSISSAYSIQGHRGCSLSKLPQWGTSWTGRDHCRSPLIKSPFSSYKCECSNFSSKYTMLQKHIICSICLVESMETAKDKA